MYSRLGHGFKSNQALLRQGSRQASMSNNSSRLSLFESVRSKDLNDRSQNKENERPADTMERLILNIERVLDQYTDLSIIIKGELNSIIRVGKSVVKSLKKSPCQTTNQRQNKENIMVNGSNRDMSREKSVLIERMKTQSQIQDLMQKLIKSKAKRAKLVDENFVLRSKVEENTKVENKLRKVIDNQSQLIQSCLKQIDKLKEKTMDSEWDEDLMSMLTLQAEQLEKAFRNNKLKARLQ